MLFVQVTNYRGLSTSLVNVARIGVITQAPDGHALIFMDGYSDDECIKTVETYDEIIAALRRAGFNEPPSPLVLHDDGDDTPLEGSDEPGIELTDDTPHIVASVPVSGERPAAAIEPASSPSASEPVGPSAG